MVSPIGKAKATAIKEVSMVPDTRDMIPKCLSSNKGVHCLSNRNSVIGTRAKKTDDSEINTQRIPAVVRMLTAAHRNNTHSITISLTFITYPYAVGRIDVPKDVRKDMPISKGLIVVSRLK